MNARRVVGNLSVGTYEMVLLQVPLGGLSRDQTVLHNSECNVRTSHK